jgi:hypothetical protein
MSSMRNHSRGACARSGHDIREKTNVRHFFFLALVLSAVRRFGPHVETTLALTMRHDEVQVLSQEQADANRQKHSLIGSTNNSEATKRKAYRRFRMQFWEIAKEPAFVGRHIIRR